MDLFKKILIYWLILCGILLHILVIYNYVNEYSTNIDKEINTINKALKLK